MSLKHILKYFGIVIIIIFSGLYCSNIQNIIDKRTKENYYNNSQNIDEGRKPLLSVSSQDWMRTWGDINDDEMLGGMDVYINTGDVYLIGWNQTTLDYNILFLKYNSSGDLEWTIELNFHIGTGQDMGQDVVVDQNTGDIYILASVLNNTSEDLFIAKYSSNGQQFWNTTWGDNDEWEYGGGITYDNSGYLYVTGTIYDFATNHSIVLVKVNKDTGIQEWNATWDDNLDDIANDVACGPSGDIYITGSTGVNIDDNDMVLINYSENNVQKWNTTWKVASNTYNESGRAISVNSQGDIYITGIIEDDPSDNNWMFLCKYESSGVNSWSIRYMSDYVTNEGNDLYIDPNDNVFVAIAGNDLLYGNSLRIEGYNTNGDEISDVRWNAVVNFLWTKAVSGYGSNIYVAGVISTGPSQENDFILVKNPSNPGSAGGGSSDGDGDDDDNGDNGEKPAEIPGYNYPILIGTLSLISTILIIKYRKKIN